MIGENMSEKEIVFCKSGGCTAKLGAGVTGTHPGAASEGEKR